MSTNDQSVLLSRLFGIFIDQGMNRDTARVFVSPHTSAGFNGINHIPYTNGQKISLGVLDPQTARDVVEAIKMSGGNIVRYPGPRINSFDITTSSAEATLDDYLIEAAYRLEVKHPTPYGFDIYTFDNAIVRPDKRIIHINMHDRSVPVFSRYDENAIRKIISLSMDEEQHLKRRDEPSDERDSLVQALISLGRSTDYSRRDILAELGVDNLTFYRTFYAVKELKRNQNGKFYHHFGHFIRCVDDSLFLTMKLIEAGYRPDVNVVANGAMTHDAGIGNSDHEEVGIKIVEEWNWLRPYIHDIGKTILGTRVIGSPPKYPPESLEAQIVRDSDKRSFSDEKYFLLGNLQLIAEFGARDPEKWYNGTLEMLQSHATALAEPAKGARNVCFAYCTEPARSLWDAGVYENTRLWLKIGKSFSRDAISYIENGGDIRFFPVHRYMTTDS